MGKRRNEDAQISKAEYASALYGKMEGDDLRGWRSSK